MKSERKKDSWKAKREAAVEGHYHGGNLPGWIEVAGGKYRLKTAEAHKVRAIFKDYTQNGFGMYRLAKKYGIAPASIGYWLDNPVVVGTLTVAEDNAGIYPVVVLDDVLVFVQYGTSEKANTQGRGVPVLRIKNIKNRQVNPADLKHIELSEKTVAGLRLEDGGILMIRTSGSRNLVGTCATFHASGEYIFASYLIRLRVDRTRIDPDYVVWFLNCPLGRQQIDATSRKIMMNNINSEEIRNLRLPLPPLDVQQQIMERVRASRAGINEVEAKAQREAEMANVDLEAMILGTNSPAPFTSDRMILGTTQAN